MVYMYYLVQSVPNQHNYDNRSLSGNITSKLSRDSRLTVFNGPPKLRVQLSDCRRRIHPVPSCTYMCEPYLKIVCSLSKQSHNIQVCKYYVSPNYECHSALTVWTELLQILPIVNVIIELYSILWNHLTNYTKQCLWPSGCLDALYVLSTCMIYTNVKPRVIYNYHPFSQKLNEAL